jgi:hypothetical protein
MFENITIRTDRRMETALSDGYSVLTRAFADFRSQLHCPVPAPREKRLSTICSILIEFSSQFVVLATEWDSIIPPDGPAISVDDDFFALRERTKFVVIDSAFAAILKEYSRLNAEFISAASVQKDSAYSDNLPIIQVALMLLTEGTTPPDIGRRLGKYQRKVKKRRLFWRMPSEMTGFDGFDAIATYGFKLRRSYEEFAKALAAFVDLLCNPPVPGETKGQLGSDGVDAEVSAKEDVIKGGTDGEEEERKILHPAVDASPHVVEQTDASKEDATSPFDDAPVKPFVKVGSCVIAEREEGPVGIVTEADEEEAEGRT